MRKVALNDGQLRDVARLLVAPVLKNKSEEDTPRMALVKAFDTQNVIIKRYSTIAPFKMPGKYHVTASKTRKKDGPRNIGPGLELFIRFFSKQDLVQIEVISKYPEDRVYSLTRREFETLKHHIRIYQKDR